MGLHLSGGIKKQGKYVLFIMFLIVWMVGGINIDWLNRGDSERIKELQEYVDIL